jgi:hypothetical protein
MDGFFVPDDSIDPTTADPIKPTTTMAKKTPKHDPNTILRNVRIKLLLKNDEIKLDNVWLTAPVLR